MAITAATLLARRTELVNGFLELEKVIPNRAARDQNYQCPKNPAWEAELVGRALYSQRPIALKAETYPGTKIYFCGPDVELVVKAIKDFVEKYPNPRDPDLVLENWQRYAVQACTEWIADNPTTPEFLKFPISEYNHILVAITAFHKDVILSSVKE